MHELACDKTADLRQHVHKYGILHDVPIVCREHVLRALVQNGIEPVSADMERHGIGAGIQSHFMQVGKIIEARQNAAAGRVVLQVVQHAVDLIELSLREAVFDAELIAVGFADGAALIGPAVPDMAAEVVDIIRLFLPDPQQFLHARAPVGAAQRHEREFLLQIIAVHHTEALDRMGRGTVRPARANGLIGVPDALAQDACTRLAVEQIGAAHFAVDSKV